MTHTKTHETHKSEKPHKTARSTADVTIPIGAYNLIELAAKAVAQMDPQHLNNTDKRTSAEQMTIRLAQEAGLPCIQNDVELAVQLAVSQSKGA